jgi:S-adenosylmethionine:tRNA ribosyltransferase-isomerase
LGKTPISDFDFALPPGRIAQRASGGRVEMLLVREVSPGTWEALVASQGRVRAGDRLYFVGSDLVASVVETPGGRPWRLVFAGGDVRAEFLRFGRAPLPPYIRRRKGRDPSDVEDRERYQTVYAAREGAIAAPTAGLHFTPRVLAELRGIGVRIVFVTLHVGLGTFKPVTAEFVEDHVMDPEPFAVGEEAAGELARAAAEGRRVVAVGTTCCRVLETLAREGGPAARSGATGLFIHPPFEFRAVGALVTNFHLPRGTPLLLACAFAGRQRVLEAYALAVREGYRFFSYGDAMMIT